MSGKPIRVALVVSHLKGGGKEQVVVSLADFLAERGFCPVTICLTTSGPLGDRIRRRGLKVIVMNKPPGKDLGLPFRLAKILKREGVDIVHSNNWGTMVECAVAAKLAGIQSVVHTQHGMDYGLNASRSQPRDHLWTLVKRLVSRWFTRIVAVSHEVLEMVVKEWHVPSERVTVIHNGISLNSKAVGHEERTEMRRRLGLSKTNFVIGSVGFFRPVKDFPALVEAMAIVVRHAPQARLVLLGEGPSRRDIETAINRLDLQPFIHLLGWRQDVDNLLPLMDLFVLCSRSEGISLSILEAMAAGLPVVATRVGGNPAIIQEMETGILVPPRSPTETARVILSLVGDPFRASVMGQRGRERVQTHFSLGQMARAYEKLYAEITG